MTSALVRVIGLPAVAAVPRIRLRWLGELLLDGTVLISFSHPFLDVAVELALSGSALPAVDGAADAESGEADKGLLGVLWVGGRVGKLTRKSPRPFYVVGTGPPRVERYLGPVDVLVDGVEVAAGESEAGAVDGVEVVKDGVVELGGEVGKS